jgi:hypothetical protein
VYNLDAKTVKGDYTNYFSNEKKSISEKETITLKPWEYLVLVKN